MIKLSTKLKKNNNNCRSYKPKARLPDKNGKKVCFINFISIKNIANISNESSKKH